MIFTNNNLRDAKTLFTHLSVAVKLPLELMWQIAVMFPLPTNFTDEQVLTRVTGCCQVSSSCFLLN